MLCVTFNAINIWDKKNIRRIESWISNTTGFQLHFWKKCICAYQRARNVSFSVNFAYVLDEWLSVENKKNKTNWVWSFEIKEICILKFPGIFNQMRIIFFQIFMTWRLHFEQIVLCFTFCVSWNTFYWTMFGF